MTRTPTPTPTPRRAARPTALFAAHAAPTAPSRPPRRPGPRRALLVFLTILPLLAATVFVTARGHDVSAAVAPVGAPGNWQLVFADEFDGTSLNRGTWQTTYPWGARNNAGENELQYYADDAFAEAGGVLGIRAERRAMGGYQYTSGIISSYASFAPTYGFFEERAKLPRGKGYWPGFWLSPQDYSQWPPEIDIFEAAGDEPNTVTMTYHYKDAQGNPQQINKDYTGPDFTADYHVFGLAWTPTTLTWYVDGAARFSTSTRGAQIPMYVMANLAIDGKNPPDASTPFPAGYDIDYIRAWTASNAPAPSASPSPSPTAKPSPSPSPKPSPSPSPSPSPTPKPSPSPTPKPSPSPSPTAKPSPSPSPKPSPSPSPVPMANTTRVVAGGGAYTDRAGHSWAADAGYSGGQTYGVGTAIAGTSDPALYQHERWGTFGYTFAVPDGDYTVTLKFAEVYWTRPGQRVFNVAINGRPVLSNFDILKEVAPNTALDKTFQVTAAGGSGVKIAFSAVVDDAKVSAIQLTPVAVSGTSASPTPKPSPTPAPSPSPTAKPSPSPSPSPAPKPIRVVAGGGSYADRAGNDWSADAGYSGGQTYDAGTAVAGTPDPTLYRHERWGTFTYHFQVPDGDYAVTLKFAEVYWTKPGQRVFNVAINGQSALSNFDILKEVAPNTALDKTFRVTATGGSGVTIAFTGVVDDAKVSAIQIAPVGPTSAAPASQPGAALAASQPAALARDSGDEDRTVAP